MTTYKHHKNYIAPTRDTQQKFVKVMNYIAKCKVCGKEYRSYGKYTYKIALKLCYTHRQIWFKQQYQKCKANPQCKAMVYEKWKRWVIRNIEKRRWWALKSYHKRKDLPKNKLRKHRRTKLI